MLGTNQRLHTPSLSGRKFTSDTANKKRANFSVNQRKKQKKYRKLEDGIIQNHH